jgi:hypothetical protein
MLEFRQCFCKKKWHKSPRYLKAMRMLFLSVLWNTCMLLFRLHALQRCRKSCRDSTSPYSLVLNAFPFPAMKLRACIHEADYSPEYGADIKNVWGWSSTLQFFFVLRRSVKQIHTPLPFLAFWGKIKHHYSSLLVHLNATGPCSFNY